ncbi:uncharacterized protein LOC111399750 [Olea europaea var. sylvestris]|uniref:uncharacterized protein LOC111399750 n=1 Tax=Olea europaea var. sylvestris TaxID=158386 RepID=UPI000C1D29BD|nr:uncharacterized protein LOC111399750 [Olea europaea var. sylvestris]
MYLRFEAECVHWYTNMKEGIDHSTTNFNALQRYIKGELPVSARPWITYNHLLIPSAYPGNTWFLFLVDFQKWKFHIYDCSHTIHTSEEIKARAEPVMTIVESLLIAAVIFSIKPSLRKHRNKHMKLKIIPYLPCQKNGPNSGVFFSNT